jgi:hypothetical protein
MKEVKLADYNARKVFPDSKLARFARLGNRSLRCTNSCIHAVVIPPTRLYFTKHCFSAYASASFNSFLKSLDCLGSRKTPPASPGVLRK